MVLWGLREKAGAHDWFGVAIELAIVMLGVFLGIQASNWNAARLDVQRGVEYRNRLIAELANTERAMAASAAYYQDVHRHALAALAALDQPEEALGTPFLVDAYQATQIFPRSANHSTWDEILSSGNVELLGPAVLRERVANYYWRTDGLMTLVAEPLRYRNALRSAMPYRVQAAIRANCDEILHDDGRGMVTPRLPSSCRLTIAPLTVSNAVAELRKMPDLRQDLNRLLVDLDSKLLQFGKVASGARELRAEIRRAAP